MHISLKAYAPSFLFGLAFIVLISWAVQRQAPGNQPSEYFATSAGVFDSTQRSVAPTGDPKIDILTHLDAHWYLDIAVHGYFYVEPQLLKTYVNTVFFPLYPYLIRWTSKVLDAHPTRVAQNLSKLFLLLSLLLYTYLYRNFIKPDDLASSGGFVDYALLLCHPMAFILICAYPESLFLLLSLSVFVSLQLKNRLLLALAVFLLVLTRPQGLFMPIAFVGADILRSLQMRRLKITGETLVTLLAGVLALGSFILLLDHLTGNPFSFWTGRRAWESETSIWNMLKTLLLPKIGPFHIVAHVFLYSGLVGAHMLWRRGLHVMAVFCAMALVMPLGKGDLGDVTRYSLAAFIAYMPIMEFLFRRHIAIWGLVLAVLGFIQGLYLQRWLQHLWVG